MTTIYQERFDVGPAITQRMVGRHCLHEPCYPPLGERGLVMCGLSEGLDSFEVERIGAPFHAVLFCLQGEFELYELDETTQARTHTLALCSGQLGILPPGGRRGFRRVGNKPCHAVWFLLSNRPHWQFLQREHNCVLPSDAGHTLADAVSLLHREAQRFHDGNAGAQVVPVLDLAVMLLERALGALRQSSGWPEQLDALFSEVSRQLDVPWSLERLAANLHITPAHLHRLCRQHLGNAPAQQLFLLRMGRARELLQHGEKVSQVAQAVGYREVASFSRRFRQHYGVSPSCIQRPANMYPQPASPSPSLHAVDAGRP
ncbi:HTH-type transcriptional regulator CdhR [Andreprevotia sp. IGB-42]|uniref:helix-turn-helix transcriptional regulator n=1 Tax=Andreprevotia sp. IGB-42 TaxID=2497473 RepID=UPI00135C5D5B|nr:helix-turn-helix domain-containing protein [Andreprevotia sp. IGB-42]KAF0813749.1 HTH-type transcriptional regulator CdhR [Andreprevotia sp. IGB-42]